MVSYDDFRKIELKTAKILDCKEHPDADRLYVVNVDLGTETRQMVAGIRGHYTSDELVGKLVVVVTNLAPATIRGVESNGMILAASSEDSLSIVTLDKDLAIGSEVK
ncbi:methionine--tRNA ligase subunit beta [Candidatus Omnitrophota bacterium]